MVSKSPRDLSQAEKQSIVSRLKPVEGQKVFFSSIKYAPLSPLNEKAETLSPEETDAVLAFSGIAHPTSFVEELKNCYKTVDFLTFADHHAYTESDIAELMKRFENLRGEKKIIVTTEKDAARLANSPYLCQLESAPLYALPVEVRFHEEEKFNAEILNYVREDLHHY